jgi:hypothetical protein
MDKITKEEMIEILKETIFYLEINKAKTSWDVADYERLDNEDYESIADDMTYFVNKLLLNRRKQKITKINELK